MNIGERLGFSCLVAVPALVALAIGTVMGSVLGFISIHSMVGAMVISTSMAVALVLAKTNILKFLDMCGAFIAVSIMTATEPVDGNASGETVTVGKRAHRVVASNFFLLIFVGACLGTSLMSYVLSRNTY